MRKVAFLSLIFSSIFIIGCGDNGNILRSQKVPSKLKVLIERRNTNDLNQKLVVYAMDFRKEGRTLTFVCPCHIADSIEEGYLNVRVEGDSFKLTVLPDAEYEVRVRYWTPNADDNTKVQYLISR